MAMATRAGRTRQIARDTLVSIVLLSFTFVVLIPFLWMILMSIRTTGGILENPYGLPEYIRWQNYYRLIFDPKIHFYTYILNSVFVTGGAMAITLALSSLGGYGFGRPRYSFRFRGVLLMVLLAALMLPRQAMYIPQFIMMSQYGLTNTLFSLILLYAAYQIPISTFLLKTYFGQLPVELEDSARIDGAHDLTIFGRIMLPLAGPVIATITIVNFRFFWNELLIALTMVTKPEVRTLPLAMMNFVGENAADYAMAAASLVVGMLPLLILYLALADRVVKGLTAGAVKG
jgi:ABC-type glycerol-3-phosphate transport system permease component